MSDWLNKQMDENGQTRGAGEAHVMWMLPTWSITLPSMSGDYTQCLPSKEDSVGEGEVQLYVGEG